ncbi:MAG: hypothetical protein IT427_05940 [Pirellulales bacterium]|nr:hypothetical protein [Pirellulales bacterium]
MAINFAVTIFVSAFLLFQVQPLIGKYILPWFGGGAAVWTTCMLFFQTLLFGGYAYAHCSVLWLKPKSQAAVHLALVVAAILFLRIVPGNDWKPLDSIHPEGKILALLAATIGLPYFVLSSTGPLLQAWFARMFPGRIPYRLYALSNVGSLLALLSYPFLFERVLNAPQQAGFWIAGFVIYAVLCGLAALTLWMLVKGCTVANHAPRLSSPAAAAMVQGKPPSDSAAAGQTSSGDSVAAPPVWWHHMLWLVLPALASIMLLATTNQVTSDVPPMPFLWVIPLALYLVTFIVAFEHSRWYRPVVFASFALASIYLLSIFPSDLENVAVSRFGTAGKVVEQVNQLVVGARNTPLSRNAKPLSISLNVMWYFAINFVALLSVCMLCHGELVRLRPHPQFLTSFYLMIAAGGAIGGLVVSIVCPLVFVTYFEFKLALFLGYLFAIGIIVRSLCNTMAARPRVMILSSLIWLIPLLAMPTLLIAGVGIHDLLDNLYRNTAAHYQKRNFFGTLRVVEVNDTNCTPAEHYYLLQNGNITHGIQYADARRRIPTTYYGNASGAGLALGYFRRLSQQIGGMRVGAVGLGTGTVAAYIDEGDSIQFYEINPNVIEASSKWFSYLRDCEESGGKSEITLGDARLSMERETKSRQFHVLVLDAFSGDAIPTHLLTQEAFEIYLRHLATPAAGGAHGAIAVHISNRHLDLEPVVRGLSEQFKLQSVRINSSDGANRIYGADWIIVTHNHELIRELMPFAKQVDRDPPPPILWTDAWNNTIDVFKW